jgi:glycosyltransferase involved in cell wall biosynthesis
MNKNISLRHNETAAGHRVNQGVKVAVLTGGGDPHYAFGLASSLASEGFAIDLIGSDEHDLPEFHEQRGVTLYNLRGSANPDVSVIKKVIRVAKYYAKLIRYAANAKPKIFHILWNNKFEVFDRTLLVLYYRILGKRIVLTVHNVNADQRDSKDTWVNRLTLRIQYRLADSLFVHTEKMKRELVEEFDVPEARVTVIPFGINNAVANTSLTPRLAKAKLDLSEDERAILFFGRISPYKGLDYLISAFRMLLQSTQTKYRLIIAGRPDRCDEYWAAIQNEISDEVRQGQVIVRSGFIPDNEIEIYFKAADVLVLPYREIYQSGVLFLGYSFGLPVIAADVGSFGEEVIEGKTGHLFRPRDPADLAKALDRYFASELYARLEMRRPEIFSYIRERHSWETVGNLTASVYSGLTPVSRSGEAFDRCTSSAREM